MIHIIGSWNLADIETLIEAGADFFHCFEPTASTIADLQKAQANWSDVGFSAVGNPFMNQDEQAEIPSWNGSVTATRSASTTETTEWLIEGWAHDDSAFWSWDRTFLPTTIVFMYSDMLAPFLPSLEESDRNPDWGEFSTVELLRLCQSDSVVGGPWGKTDIEWLREQQVSPAGFAICAESTTNLGSEPRGVWRGFANPNTIEHAVETIAAILEKG